RRPTARARRDRVSRACQGRRRRAGGTGGTGAGGGRPRDPGLGRREHAMAELTYRGAIAAGIAQESERDRAVVMLGEDIGAAGGVFKLTEGLLDQFGPERIRDT